MAAQVERSITTPWRASETAWLLDQITPSAVQELFMTQLRWLVEDQQKRLTATELTVLDQGVWYPNDYAEACIQRNQSKRLDFLIRQHAFLDGYPPQGFEKVKSDQRLSGYESLFYQLKENQTPCQGLDSLLNKRFSFIDCAMAIDIAVYMTLQKIIGRAGFDHLFSKTKEFPFQVSTQNPSTKPLTLMGIVKRTTLDLNKESLQPADCVYFPNLPFYRTEHPQGDFAGLYAMCISSLDTPDAEKRFIGLGTPATGLTPSEITDLFLNALTQPPVPLSERLPPITAKKLQEILDQLPEDPEEEASIKCFKELNPFQQKEMFSKTIAEITEADKGHYPLITRLNIGRIRLIAETIQHANSL